MWFGIRIPLFAAFGENPPSSRPATGSFRKNVQASCGAFSISGRESTSWSDLAKTVVTNDRTRQDSEWRAHGYRTKLAEFSVTYVQVWERREAAHC